MPVVSLRPVPYFALLAGTNIRLKGSSEQALSFAGIYAMPNIAIDLKSDERGFLYLEYLGKRLMTFRGEQKLILRQRIKQVEEEITNEARSKISPLKGAVVEVCVRPELCANPQ